MIQGLLEATSVSSEVIHCGNKSIKEKNRKSEMEGNRLNLCCSNTEVSGS